MITKKKAVELISEAAKKDTKHRFETTEPACKTINPVVFKKNGVFFSPCLKCHREIQVIEKTGELTGSVVSGSGVEHCLI